MKIFIDILLIGNFLITVFCLKLLKKLTGIHISKCRVFAAGSVSAAGAVILILIPQSLIEKLLILLLKAVIALTVTAIAVGINNRMRYIRCFVIYTITDLMICGICTAIWQLTGSRVFLVRNCTVYLDIPIWLMIVCTCAAYLLITIYHRIVSYSYAKQISYKAVYTINDDSFTIPAICDSGNMLTDCFSGEPVVVFSSDRIYSRLGLDDPSIFTDNGFHLVPYTTVSGTSLMPVTHKGEVRVIYPDGTDITLKCAAGFVKGVGNERAIFAASLII